MSESKQCLLMLLILLSPFAYAKSPVFGDYPVKVNQPYKNKSLLLNGKAKSYMTLFKDLNKQKTNFSGHYVLDTFGCGGGCQSIAVINRATGRGFLHPHDFSDCYHEKYGYIGRDLEFKANSRLLILTGRRGADISQCERVYYLVEANHFKTLKQEWLYPTKSK